MKIAFVGKGGAGKSTLAALFIRYLQSQGRAILAIDADLNMNLGGLLGVSFPRERLLAAPAVSHALRSFLRGTNNRVRDAASFLPTTPPAAGSNVVRRHDQPQLSKYSVDVDPRLRLMTVGTYEGSGIGQTCYHSHLFVAENLLSHTDARDFDIVVDMVAGTDSFAYSMYLQFDALVLVAEPTPESAEVCSLYLSLAEEAGIRPLVHLIANKIECEEDLEFLRKTVGAEPLAYVEHIGTLKRLRQAGGSIPSECCTHSAQEALRAAESAARNPTISAQIRCHMLYELHAQLCKKDWVQSAYGDVTGHVDINYTVHGGSL
jgi:CO dehydrogenase maturation factor